MKQTARVLLMDQPTSLGTAVAPRLLKILTLREALALVMEEIEPPLKPAAIIKCADRIWHCKGIKAAFQMMKGQPQR